MSAPGPGRLAGAGPPADLRRASALVYVETLESPLPSEEDLHHLVSVLRLRDGEPVAASDGAGAYRACRLVLGARAKRGHREARLEPTGELHHLPAGRPVLAVGFAMAKGDRPDWVVQKLTELGIDTIVPFLSERTVVRLDPGEATRRAERLRRVARAASGQSRRVFLPVVTEPRPLSEVLASAPSGTVLAEPDGPPLAKEATFVLTGPEGGFSPAELALAPALAGLGATVLRAETAAMVAGVLLAARRNRAPCGLGAGSGRSGPEDDPGPG